MAVIQTKQNPFYITKKDIYDFVSLEHFTQKRRRSMIGRAVDAANILYNNNNFLSKKIILQLCIEKKKEERYYCLFFIFFLIYFVLFVAHDDK